MNPGGLQPQSQTGQKQDGEDETAASNLHEDVPLFGRGN